MMVRKALAGSGPKDHQGRRVQSSRRPAVVEIFSFLCKALIVSSVLLAKVRGLAEEAEDDEDPLERYHPHPDFVPLDDTIKRILARNTSSLPWSHPSSRRLGKKRYCEPMRAGEPVNENTRTCLRQCQLNEVKEVIPDFFDWEDYCYNTATDEVWDPECIQFYCCLFGCEVFGGDRSYCYTVRPDDRQELLNRVKMRQIPKGDRCDAEKCRGFCVRSEFGTCRELQYTSSCKSSKLGLYKCNVQCNHAARHHGAPTQAWLVIASLLLLFVAVAPLS